VSLRDYKRKALISNQYHQTANSIQIKLIVLLLQDLQDGLVLIRTRLKYVEAADGQRGQEAWDVEHGNHGEGLLGLQRLSVAESELVNAAHRFSYYERNIVVTV